MAIWRCQASACSHAASQTTASSPAVLEGVQWLPCWGGEHAHVSPRWTDSSRAASALALFPYPAALPALVLFCSQISSHLQLPVHADTGERSGTAVAA